MIELEVCFNPYYTYANPEVRHSNTEENVHLRKKYKNILGTPSLILLYVKIPVHLQSRNTYTIKKGRNVMGILRKHRRDIDISSYKIDEATKRAWLQQIK